MDPVLADGLIESQAIEHIVLSTIHFDADTEVMKTDITDPDIMMAAIEEEPDPLIIFVPVELRKVILLISPRAEDHVGPALAAPQEGSLPVAEPSPPAKRIHSGLGSFGGESPEDLHMGEKVPSGRTMNGLVKRHIPVQTIRLGLRLPGPRRTPFQVTDHTPFEVRVL